METIIKNLLKELTLEEKAGLCSGMDFWTTKSVVRVNVPSARMADGPHGLRKENDADDNVGAKESFPATAFPPAVNQASSWNPSLITKMGECLADECKDQEVMTLLGPGVNIKRNPKCGRNFEYMSEDPYLSGKMGVAYINGVQSKNIGTSLKHFCANSQEKLRMVINEIVDERALREIYLAAFESCIKEAQPWTIMCSYNRLNGTYLSDNKRLLTDILRNEWGFKGLVVSDWNATNNRVEGVRSGMDLEMPASGGSNDRKILAAIKDGSLTEKELDIDVSRVLRYVFTCHKYFEKDYIGNYEYAHDIAKEIASQSCVLMKNEAINGEKLLPCKENKITIIGSLAKHPRYQGAGSSKINPFKLVSLLDACDIAKIDYSYSDGYTIDGDGYNEEEINKAVELAKNSKTVILCIGLTDNYESEGYDRLNICLPKGQVELLNKIHEINKNIAVVLYGGSPIEMPWIDKIPSLLNAYLPGEAGGTAVLDIILGKTNPSGKLAETYPLSLSDYMPDQYFGCGPKTVEHRESIFVGYRYYDTAKKKVLFPFGHGLSYTNFKYSNISIDGKKVSFTITNIGDKDGFEVSQLYISKIKSKIFRAEKELKGFAKTFIKASESVDISIELNDRSFSFYNTDTNSWCIEDGEYKILVGSSSRDIRLEITTTLNGEKKLPNYSGCPVYKNLENATEIPTEEFESLYGDKLPINSPTPRGEFDHNTTIGEFSSCIIGKIFLKLAPAVIKSQVPNADFTTLLMLQQGMTEMPLRGLVGITSGLLDVEFIEGMLMWGNKKRFIGFFRMFWGLLMSLRNITRKDAKNKEMKAAIKAEQEAKAKEKAALREKLKQEKAKLKEQLKGAKTEEEIQEALIRKSALATKKAQLREHNNKSSKKTQSSKDEN